GYSIPHQEEGNPIVFSISHTFLAWTLHGNRIGLPIGLVVSVLVPIALRSVSLPLPLLEQPVDCWHLGSGSGDLVQGRKVVVRAGLKLPVLPAPAAAAWMLPLLVGQAF